MISKLDRVGKFSVTSSRAALTHKDLCEICCSHCLNVTSHFSNRLGPVGQQRSKSNSAFCVKWWAMKYSLKQRAAALIWTVKGVFTPFRGHCSGTAHHRATSKACQKYRWVWTEAGKFTKAIIHSRYTWRRGGKTLNIGCCLLFHIFSLYYYKTLHRQLLISTLEWNTEGQNSKK